VLEVLNQTESLPPACELNTKLAIALNNDTDVTIT
jgi:hypothetical protein